MHNYGGPFEEYQQQPPPMESTSQNFAPFAVNGLPGVSNFADQQPSGNIVVSLRFPEIWNTLRPVGITMHAHKAGRVMDPKLEYEVVGLDPNKMYAMHVHFVRTNRNFLTYENGVWNENINVVKNVAAKTNVICLGIMSGDHWMRHGIESVDLKIFNPPKYNVRGEDVSRVLRNEQTMINVTHRCRYVPVLEIYECGEAHNLLCHTAKFDETEFVVASDLRKREVITMRNDANLDTSADNERTAPASSNQEQQHEWFPYN
ncbi:unnamed protein product [Caenorhabditis sp. 36 PRJEB53466]|nr:unnamed protein product [Caenorhabditis sp. 36 PRJEB53466]